MHFLRIFLLCSLLFHPFRLPSPPVPLPMFSLSLLHFFFSGRFRTLNSVPSYRAPTLYQGLWWAGSIYSRKQDLVSLLTRNEPTEGDRPTQAQIPVTQGQGLRTCELSSSIGR